MGTLIVGLIVFGIVGLAAYKTVKAHTDGTSCRGCSGCGCPKDNGSAEVCEKNH